MKKIFFSEDVKFIDNVEQYLYNSLSKQFQTVTEQIFHIQISKNISQFIQKHSNK